MRKDKIEAFKLRKQGKSYNEIRQALRIPKSTLSDWLKEVEWSRRLKTALSKRAKEKGKITLRELDRIRGINLTRIYKEAEREAEIEFEHFKFYPLFIVGVVVYWGEGDKISRNIVRISNTDPLMIKLFVKFLVDVCGISPAKVRASILLYPDLNGAECKTFWVKNSGLLEENFNKSIVIKGRHKTRRLRYGVCTVVVSSTYLKKKILMWLTLLPNHLLKSREKLLAGLV